MGQALTHGVYLPDEGERNCYNGLASNWSILDGAVGTVASHTTALAGKANAVHTHTKSDITDLFNSANTWTGQQTFAQTGNTQSTGFCNLNFNPETSGQSAITATYRTQLQFTTSQNSGYGAIEGIGLSDATQIRLGATYWTGANTSEYGYIQFSYNGTVGTFYPRNATGYYLGTANKPWEKLYAKDYYYNGTAWGLDKDNSWSNFNRFNGYRLQIKHISQEIGVIPTSNQWNGFNFVDKNNNPTVAFEHAFMGSGETRFKITMVDNYASHNSDSTVLVEFLRLYTSSDGRAFCIGAETRPLANNTYNLGTSTSKWKTLNGVNPGALSLPDLARYTDLTSKIPSASLGGNTDIDLSSYITSNGWLSIAVPDTNTDDYVFCQNGSNLSNRFFMSGARGNGFISLMMPINIAGAVNVQIKASSVTFCRFYKCLGTV